MMISNSCTCGWFHAQLEQKILMVSTQGVNGVGERMMILWDKLVHSGKGSPQKFVALTSANAAKLFNLYPDKGRVEIGSQVNVSIEIKNIMRKNF